MKKKTRKAKIDAVLDSSDGQFFIDRLAQILLMQVEQEALAKTGSNENETRKTRQSA
jgi:hypothetical protein